MAEWFVTPEQRLPARARSVWTRTRAKPSRGYEVQITRAAWETRVAETASGQEPGRTERLILINEIELM